MITEETESILDTIPGELQQEHPEAGTPITAEIIADYLLCLFHARGEKVNDLKLQKLLYYIQAWYLAFYEEPQHLQNRAQHCHPINWGDPGITRPQGFAHLGEQALYRVA